MENHQLALLVAKLAAASSTFINRFHGGERLPAAAIFDGDLQSSPYCAICLNDICGGDSYRKLPRCGHCFHSKCIDVWFRSNSSCPLCRTQVPQIISLNENQYKWNDFVSRILILLQEFMRKMHNPLNDELASMLCGNI